MLIRSLAALSEYYQTQMPILMVLNPQHEAPRFGITALYYLVAGLLKYKTYFFHAMSRLAYSVTG